MITTTKQNNDKAPWQKGQLGSSSSVDTVKKVVTIWSRKKPTRKRLQVQASKKNFLIQNITLLMKVCCVKCGCVIIFLLCSHEEYLLLLHLKEILPVNLGWCTNIINKVAAVMEMYLWMLACKYCCVISSQDGVMSFISDEHVFFIV